MNARRMFRREVEQLLHHWQSDGPPPRWRLREQLKDLKANRQTLGIPSLWAVPPAIVTATLDDGWGHGIETVALCARALGMTLHTLGLLVPPSEIAAACRRLRPDFLALTVLQVESKEALQLITDQVSPATQVFVGGALVQSCPQAFNRPNLLAASNLTVFVEQLLRHQAQADGFQSAVG